MRDAAAREEANGPRRAAVRAAFWCLPWGRTLSPIFVNCCYQSTIAHTGKAARELGGRGGQRGTQESSEVRLGRAQSDSCPPKVNNRRENAGISHFAPSAPARQVGHCVSWRIALQRCRVLCIWLRGAAGTAGSDANDNPGRRAQRVGAAHQALPIHAETVTRICCSSPALARSSLSSQCSCAF